MTPSDIWAAGALDTAAAVKFLACSAPTLRAIARQQGWPKRYQGTKVLYPRAGAQAYLESLPDQPPANLKARVQRIGRSIT